MKFQQKMRELGNLVVEVRGNRREWEFDFAMAMRGRSGQGNKVVAHTTPRRAPRPRLNTEDI